jgi:16S rRNA (adenine1518-N6/adenine1519-N6)-dimethyltransferase
MHGHQPRKRFGQNFLADPHYVARIVDAVAPQPGDRIVEIGPGLAALTRPLIERAGHLDAIEIDRDLAGRLASDFPPAQLTLHVTDALAFDFATLGPALKIVGNLPLQHQLAAALSPCAVRRAPRRCPRHAAKGSGRAHDGGSGHPGVRAAHRDAAGSVPGCASLCGPAGAFRPVPKVDSAVVRLVPLGEKKPDIADVALFGRIVAAAFGQRRKTMRNALSTICDEAALRRAGIDPERGEKR